MLRLLKTISLFLLPVFLTAQHPVTFFTKAEAAEIKRDITKYPLLTRSYNEIKNEVDAWIGTDVDVPFPKDPAGGYTHDKHKANYMLMFNSGILYNLTGDNKYASLVKQLFLKYAKLNPALKNHPEATSSSPGRIFWQALNDANWLVYTGMAYDLIYNSLSSSERQTIEDGAFKPEVDFITKDLKNWFNLIHNHGVWACAGVGIVGIATNNKEYVDMALYGTEKNGKSGFIAQMDGLFSPDGYYTEGPYYVRYAILPYYLFANALKNARPQLNVFEYRNRILLKALLSGLQQTNLDGAFFPLNDALKEKDYTSNELITAIDVAWNVYGKANGLLVVAKKQDRVLLNNGGVSIAATIASGKNIPEYYPYHTVEYTDGVKGDEGGVSVLRNGKGKDLTTLIYKYTSHGLSHGHFDKLNISLYDKGNEILTDYGSVRFIGVEQKYGGRYLPENKTYASQTIAHNTLVLDETSHFNGKENEAEKYHSEKLFSDISDPNVQVVAARENNAYKNADLQRTIYMLQLPGGKKIIVDVFNAKSTEKVQFDLPFQYNGQLISTSFKYNYSEKVQETFGEKNGYQFLWKEGEATVKDTIAQFTFLNNRTYYSISSLIEGTASLFFTRTGANDPNFNLRREPAFIIRKNGSGQSFINVLEIHGKFDPIVEFSTNSYSSVQNMKLLENGDYSVIEIIINGKKILIAQSNNDFNKTTKHSAKEISWTGPFTVLYDGKNLK
jgi:oligo-alginate lyase